MFSTFCYIFKMVFLKWYFTGRYGVKNRMNFRGVKHIHFGGQTFFWKQAFVSAIPPGHLNCVPSVILLKCTVTSHVIWVSHKLHILINVFILVVTFQNEEFVQDSIWCWVLCCVTYHGLVGVVSPYCVCSWVWKLALNRCFTS